MQDDIPASRSPEHFLGQGWHFPPTFTIGGAGVWQVAGEECIRQSLQILLTTAQGERVMREDFGCDLNHFMFEEMDSRLAGDVAAFVKSALLRHEPRIVVESVDAHADAALDGVLNIRVSYRIPATNSRYNLVYPFYLREGAGARS